VFLYYSGHGSQLSDTSRDERDGLDECIVPADCYESGVITDDELTNVLLTKLPSDAMVVMVSDSCHSGTILDLPYKYGTPTIQSKLTLKPRVWSLSGCRDSESSMSAYNVDRTRGWRGALTVMLEKVLRENQLHPPAKMVLESCQTNLKHAGFSQIPQLCFSHKEDADGISPFF
jgi:hypothetical protein